MGISGDNELVAGLTAPLALMTSQVVCKGFRSTKHFSPFHPCGPHTLIPERDRRVDLQKALLRVLEFVNER